MTARATRLARVGLTVADLARAETFYRDALGFTAVGAVATDPAWDTLLGGRTRARRLRLGQQELLLSQFDMLGAAYPAGSTAADLWFQHFAIVAADIEGAYQRLLGHAATPITDGGPQRLPASSGGVTAYKFRDPDGHPLELIQFPPGTGDPLWRRHGPGALTLGIDHSALSVSDADRSVAFYAGLLGFTQADRQVNTGQEQDRLDGLAGVVVDVVALRPRDVATPHVELLGYRSPHGRPSPLPRRQSDVATARLILEVEELAAALDGIALPAPIATLADGTRAALVADPDGHALVLVQPPEAKPG